MVPPPDDRFVRQHQQRVRRLIKGPDGKQQLVVVNQAESPLARLRQRNFINALQFDAGERLRHDFTIARIAPRLGIDLGAPILRKARGQQGATLLNDTVLAAKQRFSAAMRAVGPGLNALLFDVCCHLRGLEEAERAKGWPQRSAKVVLGIALDRLADHYGMRIAGTARLRGWQKEDPSAGSG
jgi:hypothetical protein